MALSGAAMWAGRRAGPCGLLLVLAAAAQLAMVSGVCARAHGLLLPAVCMLLRGMALPGAAAPAAQAAMAPAAGLAPAAAARPARISRPAAGGAPGTTVPAASARWRYAAPVSARALPPPAFRAAPRAPGGGARCAAQALMNDVRAVRRASSKLSLCAHRLEDVPGHRAQRAGCSWILRPRIPRGVRGQDERQVSAQGRVYDPLGVAQWRLELAVYVGRLHNANCQFPRQVQWRAQV